MRVDSRPERRPSANTRRKEACETPTNVVGDCHRAELPVNSRESTWIRKNMPGKPSSRMQFTKRNRTKRKQKLTPQKPLSLTGWATPGLAQASLKNRSYSKHSTPF